MNNILKLDIKKVKDCYGGYSYIGYKEEKQYTDCHDTVEEIKEQYDTFKDIDIISKEEWDKTPKDYKGVYSDWQGHSPELKGLRTTLKLINGATCLIFEGIHFIIV